MDFSTRSTWSLRAEWGTHDFAENAVLVSPDSHNNKYRGLWDLNDKNMFFPILGAVMPVSGCRKVSHQRSFSSQTTALQTCSHCGLSSGVNSEKRFTDRITQNVFSHGMFLYVYVEKTAALERGSYMACPCVCTWKGDLSLLSFL